MKTAIYQPKRPHASVRAEGLEPSSSFEHGHLKPARLPSFATPACPAILPLCSLMNLSVVRAMFGHHTRTRRGLCDQPRSSIRFSASSGPV
jgi:hypothetical protein